MRLARRAVATIGRHIDGDTFVADQIDPGWGFVLRPDNPDEPGKCAVRVLLPGGGRFDAWEVRGPDRAKGLLAAARAAELLPVGGKVALESYGIDNFGRTLASVTLPDGQDLAMTLWSEGHARPSDSAGQG